MMGEASDDPLLDAMEDETAQAVLSLLAGVAKRFPDHDSVCALHNGALEGVLRFSWAIRNPEVPIKTVIKAIQEDVAVVIREIAGAEREAMN